jgi:maltooligosyltrehalose trehalohydrolase
VTDETRRRLPVGAELAPGGVHFRVWAPDHERVEVVIEGRERAFALAQEREGYFAALVEGVGPGARYKYRLDGGDAVPDPASRFQPDGPHGASEVIDPEAFAWSDSQWPGPSPTGQVIYELHVGTFTPEGSWAAAAEKIPHLAETGVTVIEMMPVAEFPGRYGWGYDGVQLFAPTRNYGRPDELRRFIDRAHAAGLAVILDVVYNHLGPDGNYLGAFAQDYFKRNEKTEWGDAINFDGENSTPVREFFIANAAYWIGEYHFDGLRLDATQDIRDETKDHILAAISRAARAAAGKRKVLLVAENEPQQSKLLRAQSEGGYGLDMLWNDDFHHSAMVALAGRYEAYYLDYRGKPQEFVSAIKHGYLYQGQWYRWQQKRRGTSTRGTRRSAFVNFIENHDQVANSPRGERPRQAAAPGVYRAITALLLLTPGTPMLFQGQEFGCSRPFHYFADHNPELRRRIHQGRIAFMSQFQSVVTPEMRGCIPEPGDSNTFERSRLDWAQLESNREIVALYRDLLRLRRSDPVLRAPDAAIDGAVLSDAAFVLRFFSDGAGDRLLVVNLGPDLELNPAPEPLLAPPDDCEWAVLWSSESPKYGGCGTPPLETTANWWIPGRAAVALKPSARREELPHRPVTQDEANELYQT